MRNTDLKLKRVETDHLKLNNIKLTVNQKFLNQGTYRINDTVHDVS